MWLNKLEEKFGRYAIPNLPKIIVLLYAVGFVIANVSPQLYSLLELNPYLILHGQVWRIVTFLLIGPETNLIFVIFVLLFYYSIGTIVGAFLTYAILTFAYGEGYGAFVNMDTFYLNMTLFLAYAAMFPEMEVYLYMILPIKVKWLGYLDGLYLIYIFFSSGFTVAGISVKVSIVAALLNFLLFFFSMKKIRRMGANFRAKTVHKKKARAYKAKTITPKKKNGAMHECAVCHRTELDDPELEFRYCSKCDGDYEYCQDHLFTHKHVKK